MPRLFEGAEGRPDFLCRPAHLWVQSLVLRADREDPRWLIGRRPPDSRRRSCEQTRFRDRWPRIARPVRVYRVPIGRSAPRERPSLALPDKHSIAVLPFQNLSGDPEQEYFADGMVEDIITELSRIRWLFVIARNSTFTYKG